MFPSSLIPIGSGHRCHCGGSRVAVRCTITYAYIGALAYLIMGLCNKDFIPRRVIMHNYETLLKVYLGRTI